MGYREAIRRALAEYLAGDRLPLEWSDSRQAIDQLNEERWFEHACRDGNYWDVLRALAEHL